MKLFVMVALLSSMYSLPASAQDMRFDHYINMPYSAVRAGLIDDGWQAVTNQQIQDTSFYAQGIFDQGYEEVLDCISMERDQCQFVLTKNKQLIMVTTKEKALNVETIETKQ